MKNIMNKNMTLDELQKYFKEVLKERGFDDQTAEDKLLLLIEEVGELAKAIRKQSSIGIDYSRIENYDSVKSEVADVTIVLLSLCNIEGINLYHAIEEKEKINSGRQWK